MNDKDFEDILDECIDRMLAGESMEECLQSYPGRAQELMPLLESAAAAQEASSIEPSLEFKNLARHEVMSKVQAEARKPEGRKRWKLPVLGWQPRWAVTAVAAFFILLIATSSTVAASSNAMPDDTLYPVKLAVENVRLRFAFSDTKKAELNSEFAERRVDEIIHLTEAGAAEDGKLRELERTRARLRSALQAIEQLALDRQEDLSQEDDRASQLETDQKLGRLRDILRSNKSSTDSSFQEARETFSEGALPTLESAEEEYQQYYDSALAATGVAPDEETTGDDNPESNMTGEEPGPKSRFGVNSLPAYCEA
jgi:hypothetical protein